MEASAAKISRSSDTTRASNSALGPTIHTPRLRARQLNLPLRKTRKRRRRSLFVRIRMTTQTMIVATQMPTATTLKHKGKRRKEKRGRLRSAPKKRRRRRRPPPASQPSRKDLQRHKVLDWLRKLQEPWPRRSHSHRHSHSNRKPKQPIQLILLSHQTPKAEAYWTSSVVAVLGNRILHSRIQQHFPS